MDRCQQAGKVLKVLRKLYPKATCELNFKNPLELLVATILSAQCTDKRVNLVTQSLFKKYKKTEDYAQVPQPVLEQEIRSTGFYHNKATSIRKMAQMLVDKFKGQVPKTMQELIQLSGVARKTANVVLGTAFKIAEGVVVDTHVKRLAYRMGLTEEENPEKIEQDLMKLVPRKDWIFFGHAMVWHGRRVCKALSPDCPNCLMKSFCPKL
ncbi:MAG: endonuclease III [Elusimicrobia bacterium]|nr:endonuclease III [Elusimicrobiota bacterium]